MTREEAIISIEEIKDFYGDEYKDGHAFEFVALEKEEIEALDMAIEALTYQNLSKPNNTCEADLISREDVMGAVQDHFNSDGFKGYYDGQQMMDRINALSSAEPKTGEWVAAHIGETTSWYVECSECHVVMPPVNYSYCPNCGAKMKG